MRRYYSYRPPLTRGQRIRLLCLLLGVVLIAFCLILAFHLHNTLSSLAVTRVSNTVNRVVTAAVNDTVKALQVGGVECSEATILDGTYSIQRPFVMITKEGTELSAAAQAFLDFAMSADAADLIAQAGAVPPAA